MNLTTWKNHGKRFDYNGHSIFYRDEGAGEPLLCVHGFPTASWDWHAVWPELTKRFRVVAPDMIGFGFSAKPPRYEYSIFDQAALHEALLGQLGIERTHVLAHDYGDTVAQELLARSDERRRTKKPGLTLASVCFLNGGLFPETHRPRLIQKLLLTPIGPLIGRVLTERGFGKSFAAVFGPRTQPTPQELRDFWTLVTENEGRKIFHRLIRYIPERQRHRARWVDPMIATTVPLRFINGAVDPVSGAHAAERYRELVPNPDVVLLDDIGHYPQVEASNRVIEAFFGFHRDRVAKGSAVRV